MLYVLWNVIYVYTYNSSGKRNQDKIYAFFVGFIILKV